MLKALLVFAAFQQPAIAEELIYYGAPTARATQLAPVIERQSRLWGADPLMITAIITLENPTLESRAVSRAGARGIMQVMPLWMQSTFSTCGRDLFDDRINLCFGVRVWKFYMDRNRNNLTAALLGYNGCVKAPGCERYATLVLERHARLLRKILAREPKPWFDHMVARADTNEQWNELTLVNYPRRYMFSTTGQKLEDHRTGRGAPLGCAPRPPRRPTDQSVETRC